MSKRLARLIKLLPTYLQTCSVPLSELTLHRSVLMIDLQSDNSVTALLNVQDCTIDDTRICE